MRFLYSHYGGHDDGAGSDGGGCDRGVETMMLCRRLETMAMAAVVVVLQ